MGITDHGIRTKAKKGGKMRRVSIQTWTISCVAMSSYLERREGVFSETVELKCIMESKGRHDKKVFKTFIAGAS